MRCRQQLRYFWVLPQCGTALFLRCFNVNWMYRHAPEGKSCVGTAKCVTVAPKCGMFLQDHWNPTGQGQQNYSQERQDSQLLPARGNCMDLGGDCSSLTCAICTSGVWLHMVPDVTPTPLKGNWDSYWMIYTMWNIKSLPVGRRILQSNPRIWYSETGRKVEGKYLYFGGFCCNFVESL